MNNTAPQEAASPEQVAAWKADFDRDGFKLIPGVFSPGEIEELKAGIDRVFDNPHFTDTDNVYGNFIGVRLFETGKIFRDVLTKEPIISLMESILGPDCHIIAQNAVRNKPGQSISQYHVDDTVFFPVAPGMERQDPNLTMPLFICTAQIPLTDIPSIEYGPSEYVPGSHFSGRNPPTQDNPQFEGKGPVPVLCKAGDIYLHNGQTWHRGMPNTSDRTRYLFQLSFGQRFVSQRFYPFINYQMPSHVLEGADDRTRRVLGIHPKGAYG